jgi:hypothetical protein
MKFKAAFRKALATFVFATTGQLVGLPLLDVDVAVWKSVVASGVGALLNLAYRWSESAVKEA